MAIKPNELEKLSEDELALVNLTEDEMDAVLREKVHDGAVTIVDGKRKIDVLMPTKLRNNPAILLRVIERYQEAGWDVQTCRKGGRGRHYNFQRDYLIFTPKQEATQ